MPAHTATLAEEVRALVRDRGIDPVRESAAVREIAERVAHAHDQRSLTGAVAPLEDVPGVVGELVAQVSGLGLLQPYLDDPAIEEIWINATGRTHPTPRTAPRLRPVQAPAARAAGSHPASRRRAGPRPDVGSTGPPRLIDPEQATG